MRLTHDGDNGYTRGTSNRLCDQARQNVLFVMFGDGIDDGGKRRGVAEEMLFGNIVAQGVEVQVLLGFLAIQLAFIVLDQGASNVGASAHVSFVLWGQFDAFGDSRVLGLGLGGRHGHGRHCGL